jgi:hypothetical protein
MIRTVALAISSVLVNRSFAATPNLLVDGSKVILEPLSM